MKARKWSEVIDSLNLNIVSIAWNSSGAEALALLREKYGDQYPELAEKEFDETADKYKKQSTETQLNALGSCMQKYGLRFGYLCMTQEVYSAFVVRCDNTKEFMMKWKEILTRRQFFSGVQTFAFRSDDEFESFEDVVAFPYSSITVRSEIESEGSSDLDRYGDYLINMVENPISNFYPPIVHAFDLHSWPIAEIEAKSEIREEYIEPAFVTFKSTLGKEEKLVGKSFSRMKLYVPDEEEADEDDSRLLRRDGGTVTDIPNIKNAEPVLTLKDRIIYCYEGEFIGAEKEQKKSDERQERSRRFRDEDQGSYCLVEYNTRTQKYRMMLFPNFNDNTELYIYNDEWILLRQDDFRSNSSYVFRLWNPEKDVFLRMPFGLMKDSELDEIEKLGDGTIVFRMNDGRLIKPEVDLVDWLSDKQQPESLPAWSEETERRYEGFKEDNRRGFRLRHYGRNEILDRYIVGFDNNLGLDIEINKES